MSHINTTYPKYITYVEEYSFTTWRSCDDPKLLIKEMIETNKKYISIVSIFDLIPSIVKLKIYYKQLKNMGFIKCSSESDIEGQILEINYVLLTRYFPFRNDILVKVNNDLDKYKDKFKIGIHVRLWNDKLNDKNVNWELVNKILNLTSNICGNRTCINTLSVFGNKFIESFSSKNNNVYVYKPYMAVKHFSKSKMAKGDEEKILGDIISVSKSDYFLLTKGSTFSLMMLYSGLYSNYEMCNRKNFSTIEGNNFYDHLEREWKEYNDCE